MQIIWHHALCITCSVPPFFTFYKRTCSAPPHPLWLHSVCVCVGGGSVTLILRLSLKLVMSAWSFCLLSLMLSISSWALFFRISMLESREEK